MIKVIFTLLKNVELIIKIWDKNMKYLKGFHSPLKEKDK